MFLAITIIIDALLLVLTAFLSIPALSDLGFPLVILLVFIYLLFTIISLVYALTIFKNKAIKVVLPLLLNVITALIIMYVPIGEYGEKIVFSWQLPRYEKVVSLIENNTVHPDKQGRINSHDIDAPTDEVAVYQDNKTQFIAFVVDGFVSKYYMYVYSPTDIPPTKGLYEDEIRGLEKLKPHWYRVAH